MFECIESGPDRVILTLTGVLDGEGASLIRDGFEAISASGNRDVVIDLSNLTFMDGSGIAAIGFLFKRLVSAGRRVDLIGAGGQPASLLHEMGLAGLFGLASKARRRPLFGRPGWALAR